MSETANEPPQDEGNSFNSPRNLAMEATYINHNFSQQCLRMVRTSRRRRPVLHLCRCVFNRRRVVVVSGRRAPQVPHHQPLRGGGHGQERGGVRRLQVSPLLVTAEGGRVKV